MTSDVDPSEFGPGGRALWDGVTEVHAIDPAQTVQLVEACRAKDRLDQLDRILRGEVECWTHIRARADADDAVFIHIDEALTKANSTATSLKQLLAALRLPDAATGRRPQHRGTARGTYGGKAAGVSSLEQARTAKTG